ncbi:MAG: MotA/TolQ/ExbB proton channel family protein [Rhodocyclaceae bacterium]|jgi:biopolymer transport protein ExbB|nr:MotA/TolQ/ExbB proton channel family protein [Rhodocyclaceae bacterium]
METTQHVAPQFGLAHLWAQADWISQSVAFLLVVMSVASWYLIALKVLRLVKERRNGDAVEAFWAAPSLADGLAALERQAPGTSFEDLARQAAAAAEHCRHHAHRNTLGGALNTDEFVTRTLRKSIALSTSRLESGLTVLASIGSTAPFVGLLGTVWGIYHALLGISAAGMATLDKVSGPVGEALIMTAFGLFVAIPAVLAYNALTRANRLELAELDAFAHDLHAFLTTGARLAPEAAAANGASPIRAVGQGAA